MSRPEFKGVVTFGKKVVITFTPDIDCDGNSALFTGWVPAPNTTPPSPEFTTGIPGVPVAHTKTVINALMLTIRVVPPASCGGNLMVTEDGQPLPDSNKSITGVTEWNYAVV